MTLPVLTIHDGKLSFGIKPLFNGLYMNVLENDHVCLIGRNGQGKSTLLKVLAEMIELDGGSFYKRPHTKIHYLPQDLSLPRNKTALDIVLETAQENYMAQMLLDALEVSPDRLTDTFSGGQKRRVLLAKALAGNPDVLLLDEPTNHLDIKAIQWLEDYLNAFNGAVVTISHDRRFLANTTRSMVWLDRGVLRQTNRGYAHFDTWCDEIFQAEQTEMEKLQSKLRLEEHWKQRGVTARRKRNQGRLERLMHMRARRSMLLSNQTKSVKIEAEKKESYGSQLVVELTDACKEFKDILKIGPFSTRVFKGDRIGIVGPNGSGKTTLLKLLIGQLPLDSGRIRLGKTIDIAYFEQERNTMDPTETPWQYLCPSGGDQVSVQGVTMHVVGYLKKFLFDEKQARGAISILSGGEKNRLQLAKILAQTSNVLVLDEPTNDLDMDTLDLLVDVLSAYEGTLILISHDRDFIDQLVTAVFAVRPDGTVIDSVGGYTEYEKQYLLPSLQKVIAKNEAPSSKVVRPKATQPKRLSYKDQREYDMIPKQISDIEKTIKEIEQDLSDPTLYVKAPDEFDALTLSLETLKNKKNLLEERWLELSIMIDEF
ncbi:MAG: ABC transporter ATP-binding protein uup [Holosporales bacterium]